MDPIHMKALTDIATGLPHAEDAFYTQHSCAWLHRLKSALRQLRPHRAHHIRTAPHDPARVSP